MDWTCQDNKIILLIFVSENKCYLDNLFLLNDYIQHPSIQPQEFKIIFKVFHMKHTMY